MDPRPTDPNPPIPSVTPVPSTSLAPSAPKWPWILLVVILLIATGIGGIFLGKQMATTTPTPLAAVPTTTTDPTAGWQTYINTPLSYSIQHPSNWAVKELLDGKIALFTSPDIEYGPSPADKVIHGNEIRIEISPYRYSGNLATLESEMGAIREGDGGVVSMERIVILENQALKIVSEGLQGKVTGIMIPNENDIYQISLRSGFKPADLVVFDQILSTFKFTSPTVMSQPTSAAPESVQLLSTAGWVTAENSIFSVKYPSETFRFNPSGNSIDLQWKNNAGSLMTNSPTFWLVDNYAGGSVSAWFLSYFNYFANEVTFTSKQLGNISVVEAKPKTQAETHSILVTNGTKLVDVMLQGADLKLVETIVSTLVFK